jgi:hypothetical protein
MKKLLVKKTVAVVVLVLMTTYANAQKTLSTDYDYKVSKPYRVVDASRKLYYSNGENVLAIKVRANKNQVLLQKYDVNNMKEVGKTPYNDLPKNFIFEDFIEAQDKYYFFYSSWSGKKTKHERLFYREVDFKSGTFIGESKQIIDYNGYLANFYGNDNGVVANVGFSFGTSGKYVGTSKFDLIVSEDKSKILILYRKKPEVKKDTKSWDIVTLNVFDMNLNEIWNKKYKMPYTERRMNFLDNIISNDGKIFMITKIYHDDNFKDKKKRTDIAANYHIELFEYNNSNEKIITSEINLDDKFMKSIAMYQPSNDKIFCAGFYNKGKDSDNADGLFTYEINPDGKLNNKNYYEIPLEILNQYEKEKTIKKNKKKNKKGKAEYEDLNLKDVIFYSNNSIVLIGEVNYIKSHTSYSQKYGTRTTYTYHYEDILITKINANGNLAWMKKIPKRQKGTQGKRGMSYTHFNTNENTYLVYLDNVKNIDLPINKLPALHSDGHGGFLTAVKINNETGAHEKGSIMDFRNIKGGFVAYQFNTDRIVKIKDNEFFTEVYKKKKEDIFLKIEF